MGLTSNIGSDDDAQVTQIISVIIWARQDADTGYVSVKMDFNLTLLEFSHKAYLGGGFRIVVYFKMTLDGFSKIIII